MAFVIDRLDKAVYITQLQVPPRPPKKTAVRLSLFLPAEPRQNRVNPLISKKNGDTGDFLLFWQLFLPICNCFCLFSPAMSATRRFLSQICTKQLIQSRLLLTVPSRILYTLRFVLKTECSCAIMGVLGKCEGVMVLCAFQISRKLSW